MIQLCDLIRIKSDRSFQGKIYSLAIHMVRTNLKELFALKQYDKALASCLYYIRKQQIEWIEEWIFLVLHNQYLQERSLKNIQEIENLIEVSIGIWINAFTKLSREMEEYLKTLWFYKNSLPPWTSSSSASSSYSQSECEYFWPLSYGVSLHSRVITALSYPQHVYFSYSSH